MEAVTYQMMRQLEDEHWWFVARRQIIGSLIERLDLPATATILEVGCGTGGNLSMLSRFGNLSAMEQDQEALEMARAREAAPVLSGELPNAIPKFSQHFDLIALLDVIEHVEDDRAGLESLARLLKPDGRILLTVPAFNFLWSQHDVENHHFRRYRKRDIRALARNCGLTLDYISYFNFWLFPPSAAVRVIRKLIPYKESWQDMRMPPAMINRVLKTVFGSERHALGKLSLPFGLSLMAVMSLPKPSR